MFWKKIDPLYDGSIINKIIMNSLILAFDLFEDKICKKYMSIGTKNEWTFCFFFCRTIQTHLGRYLEEIKTNPF